MRVESASQIPAPVLEKFAEWRDRIDARTILPWGEHCTECVWPSCYSTCDLYTPRKDGKCRRFVDGMVRIEAPGSSSSYLLKIRIKRWGQLWTPGNLRLYPTSEAQRIERRDRQIGQVLFNLPLPSMALKTITGRRYNYKKKRVIHQHPAKEIPNGFLLEIYNPAEQPVSLSLSIRPFAGANRVPFQRLIAAHPGFNRIEIACAEIAAVTDLGEPFQISLTPNQIADDSTLYFGMMDFIQTSAVASSTSFMRQSSDTVEAPKAVKCVVWDLDNTLWNSILIEDGDASLALRPGLLEAIKALDARGILHSVASKNNEDDALRALKALHIDEYFLCPQISWGPKREAVKRIAKKLNIGLNTLLFVDDSPFELEEVKSALPEVRVLDAAECLSLPELPEFQVPVTSDSVNRRKLYQLEAVRETVAGSFGADYLSFLKDCGIRLRIAPLTPLTIDRVHELTQRTNQMNFSGTRYTRPLLEQILAKESMDTYILDCEDRFGSYGTVGFALVERREPRITDLMFSCRIQSKRVEHAFLAWILRKYISELGADCFVNYRKTPRNAQAGQVFDDFGMELISENDGVSSLVFRTNRDVPEDGLINVVEERAEFAGQVIMQ